MTCYQDLDTPPERMEMRAKGRTGPWIFRTLCGLWRRPAYLVATGATCPICRRRDAGNGDRLPMPHTG